MLMKFSMDLSPELSISAGKVAGRQCALGPVVSHTFTADSLSPAAESTVAELQIPFLVFTLSHFYFSSYIQSVLLTDSGL